MSERKRHYHQFCSVARALDVVGERWSLLIIRELLLGPRRYSDLLARLKGITPNLLAKRLADMECHDLITKQQHSSIGSTHVYELSEVGRELEPVVLSLGRFGIRYMLSGPKDDDLMDIGWGLLVLKLRYQGQKSGTITLLLDGDADAVIQCYQVKFSPSYVDIRHGQHWASDVVVSLSVLDYRRLAFQGASLAELNAKNKIKVEGQQKKWLHFLVSFGFELE
ncbi:MAG: helix-turn-helix transcriptional regulator [Gammaproteobacteria bacterium]|nr:helix-turn-helix transcriptional regulator [Gammaproteobacteria bacterium]